MATSGASVASTSVPAKIAYANAVASSTAVSFALVKRSATNPAGSAVSADSKITIGTWYAFASDSAGDELPAAMPHSDDSTSAATTAVIASMVSWDRVIGRA